MSAVDCQYNFGCCVFDVRLELVLLVNNGSAAMRSCFSDEPQMVQITYSQTMYRTHSCTDSQHSSNTRLDVSCNMRY